MSATVYANCFACNGITTTTTTTAAPTTTTTTTATPPPATTTTTTTPEPQYLSYDLYICGSNPPVPASLRLPYTGNLDPGVIVMGCVDGTCYCYNIAGPTYVGGAQLTFNGEYESCPLCEEAKPVPTTTTTTTSTPPPPATTTTTTTSAPITTTTTTTPPFTGCIKWINEFDYDQAVTCEGNSGTDVYYELTASLFELDGVTPKNAPFGGVLVTFDAAGTGPCIPSGGTFTVTILEGNNSVVAPYQQTNYSECGFGCSYNTFTPFQFAYTNYPYVNECPE
jgi:hypothetical protein